MSTRRRCVRLAHLGRDRANQPHEGGGSQRLPQPEDPLEARKADLYSLPYPGPSGTGFAADQQDTRLGRLLLELLAPIGRVCEQFAGYYLLPEARTPRRAQFFRRRNFRYVGRGKLLRERDPVGGAKQVQLNPVETPKEEPHLLTHAAAPSEPADCSTWRGCGTESRAESTIRVSRAPLPARARWRAAQGLEVAPEPTDGRGDGTRRRGEDPRRPRGTGARRTGRVRARRRNARTPRL